jgi:dynein assembly factor 1, axonemal
LNDNIIDKIEGLAGCTELQTLHLQSNRLGQHRDMTDIDAIKGVLDCPSITSLDIQKNYLHDPAILDEVIVKMPNLKVLYCQNNEFVKKISNYRKTTIVKIPTLMYLDDRPVFPEDRRRAEAFVRGGLTEERAEMKLIKKEKEDKHWANHEAF